MTVTAEIPSFQLGNAAEPGTVWDGGTGNPDTGAPFWARNSHCPPSPGLGFACLYQAAAVMTAKRCRARLALANALARSGMGLTFLMAPFTQLLIEIYAWQGEPAPPCSLKFVFLLPLFQIHRRSGRVFGEIWAG